MTPMVQPWPSVEDDRAAPSARSAHPVIAVACAAFDAVTDDAVLAVRDTVRAAGVRLPPRPRHRPHVTLAAVRVHPARLDEVRADLEEVVARHAAFDLALARVGRFGRSGALWLGPGEDDGTWALRDLQRDVDATLDAVGWERAFRARSRPADWVPHCTLGTRLPPALLRQAQSSVRAGYRPIDATVAAVAVILVGGSGDTALLRL